MRLKTQITDKLYLVSRGMSLEMEKIPPRKEFSFSYVTSNFNQLNLFRIYYIEYLQPPHSARYFLQDLV